MGTFSGLVLLIMLFAALFPALITAYGPTQVRLRDVYQGPSLLHYFGTDNFGRDVFSRVVYGARVSMPAGLIVVLISTVVSTLAGGVPGYVGGWIDAAFQRFVDAWMSMPFLVVVLVLSAVLAPGFVTIVVVLGVSIGINSSRLVRSVSISIRQQQFVDAAYALGSTRQRIFVFHILPNTIPTLLVLATLHLGSAILSEASLSFLGYGIPPPNPTWGGMLASSGMQYMMRAPWMSIFPGLVLTLVVFSANMFGDALRDVLDPRLRGGRPP
ncbi:MAG: ABC transporter permease [Chloroflexi bacterium]|nr:ABC transporter permease [Chloroflexota bacterium]